MRSTITCLLLLIICTTLSAALYQVGPGKPYANLQAVTGLLNPGDIVEVDGDETYPGGVVFNRPGAPGNKIIIRGIRINNQRPIISGAVNTVTFATPFPYNNPNGGHHYIFEGFEITAGSFRGIFHQAKDLTIRDCYVHDCPAHGILGADQGAGSLLLEYTEVTKCGSGTSQHQVYMATDQINNPGSVFRMQFCYIHEATGGNNVKSRAERNEIYFNWVEGAFYHELELIGADFNADGGNPQLAREDSDVVGNVLIKRSTLAGNEINFSVTRIGGDGTGASHGRYRFVNNTIICGTGAVFRIFDQLQSAEFHNNVLYNPSGVPRFKRTVEAIWIEGMEIIAGQNNWLETGILEVPAGISGTIFGSDPGFQDLNNNILIPIAGSPLINSGNLPTSSPAGFPFPNPLPSPTHHPPSGTWMSPEENTPRFIVNIIDIGAFEFGSSLPVSLLHFDAKTLDDSRIKLDWKISEADDLEYFEVYKSTDASNWTKAGIIPSGHESENLESYTWTDDSSTNGINYYKLRIINRDGSFKYSPLASASILKED
ncbi:MAG: hypothetical protein IPI60_14845 [Saprospiraceae bacterium]|nr:hypothetical protein [Saprospiraceae bacterium]